MRFLARILAVLVLGLGLCAIHAPTPAMAQPATSTAPEFDQAAWEVVAERAEEALAEGRASDEALDALRAELDEWRDSFVAARQTNAVSIATTEAQLEALGPPPAEGESEPAAVAQQRARLTEQLSELEAPAVAADVAWNRADSLIREIDRTLRDRQTTRLLERGPAPLNPANWPDALSAVWSGTQDLSQEVRSAWQNPANRQEASDKLAIVLGLLAIAVVLLARGRYWVERLTLRVLGQERSAHRYLAGILISLGQVILPVAGTIALVAAALATQMVGPKSTELLKVLPGAMLAFALARWVGVTIFPSGEVAEPPIRLARQGRLEGRLHCTFLGIILAAYVLLQEFGKGQDWSLSALNVVLYPLIVLAGIMLYRLAQLIGLHSRAEQMGDAETSFRQSLVFLVSRIVIALSAIGPLLAGIGYFNAGYAIVFPTIFSLQTIGVLTILQRVLTEIYVLISRNREGARDGLAPVLIGFMLALVSLPIFAIIWGARSTDLTELWQRFMAGFTVGDTVISPSIFIIAVVVFVLGVACTRLVQGTLRTTVLPKTKIDAGAQSAMVSGLGYVGIFLAALLAITSAGINLSALGYVAGALSVGIGFGLQNIVSNFVSGIILLIERPVSEGDWIEVGGNMGFVRSISVRSTRIETFDRQDVIVPNADLISGTVTNWTRGNLVGRLVLPVGVAYGSDTRRIEAILKEIAEAQPIVVLNPPPYIFFKGFGASSLDFEVRAVLRDVTQVLVVQTEMNHQIAERFAAEGIEIPFPQQDVWLRNPETLRQPPPARTEPLEPHEVASVAQAERQRATGAHLTQEDLHPGPDTGDDR